MSGNGRVKLQTNVVDAAVSPRVVGRHGIVVFYRVFEDIRERVAPIEDQEEEEGGVGGGSSS